MKKGWEVKKISEIGSVQNGNSINENVKKDKYTGIKDGLPFIATKDISFDNIIDYSNGVKIPFHEKNLFKVAPKNTVLICAEGGSAGRKIAITNQEVCFGNKLFALDANKDIESRYVYYYYLSSMFQKQFANELTGVIGGVSLSKFKALEIPMPSFLEQQRIVAILDQIFTVIINTKTYVEQNLKNTKEFFDHYLQSVFESKGGGRWKSNNLEAILAEAPKNGWSPPAKNHTDSGIPVLTLSAVTGFDFKSECVKYTNANVKKKASYWINNGDLLITRSNTPELVGHVAVCKDIFKMTIYPDLMMRINPNESIVLTQFLYYQLRSPKLRQIIKESAHGANPTMKKINKQDVQSFEISYPSLSEQKAMIQIFDALSVKTQQLESIYQEKASYLEEFKKSILQKAFMGNLN